MTMRYLLRLAQGRHPAIVAAIAVALVLTGTALNAAEALPLRGFGKVEVTERVHLAKSQSWVTFSAEDAPHAGVVGSKFMADLIGFGDLKERKDPGLPGTSIVLEGSGQWLIALDGAKCQVLFARTPAAILTMLDGVDTAGWRPVQPNSYPRWLDCFDNAGTGMWWGRSSQDISADMQWVKRRDFTVAHHGPENNRYVLPGVVDFSLSDWFASEMKKYDRPYRVYLWPKTTSAGWNYDTLPWATPGTLKIISPDIRWQQSQVTGQFVPAGGTETPEAVDRYLGDYRRRMAEHLEGDPNYMGGTQVVSENNGASILRLAMVAGMPEFKRLWREYLQGVLGFDLAKAGLMHKGDRSHYASWDEVNVPEPQDLLGFNGNCVNLVGMWEGHADRGKIGTAARWYIPTEAPQDNWRPIHCNDPMLMMYDAADNRMRTKREKIPDYWIRRTISLTEFQVAGLKYLHISRNTNYDAPPRTPLFDVYVNGAELKKLEVDRFEENFSQCLEVGAALKAGDNHIVINTLGCPVPGYIFLGATPLRLYPLMTDPENRLWYDAVQFDAWLKIRAYKRTLGAFRSIDRNRPFKLSTTADFLDQIIPICEEYGAYPHNSGGAGAYWCPMYGARLGTTHGIPFSCEQGGPPDTAANLQAAMTYYLMYGNHAIDLVFSIAAYRNKPDVAEWIDRNLSLMHCIGKIDLPLPPIGILRSTRGERLGLRDHTHWDLGRGAVQSVGRNFAYVEIPDISNGAIDRFPVVVDDGTSLMCPEDVEGIEKYVRAGGTFVALHNTGMHTPERANSWPISQLTGLRVLKNSIRTGQLRFLDDQTLWPTLRGSKGPGLGLVIDYLDNKQATGSIGAEPDAKDIDVIAEWDNVPAGQGRIAIARRRIGKGQVVLLGSTFWRDSRDLFGKYKDSDRSLAMLDELFTSLGVQRDSRTSNPDVWAERWVSKNGVYDLFAVARMTQQKSVEEDEMVKVALRQPDKIEEVVEFSANGHPRSTVVWHDGNITLPETSYGRMQYRLYGAPRADLEDAALKWFDVQRRLWRGLPAIPPTARPDVIEPPADIVTLAEGWKMSEAAPDAGWQLGGQVTGNWKPVKLGSFSAMGLPDDAKAWFCKTIAIPAGWREHKVQLVFDSQYSFGIFQKGRLWINGREPAIQPNRSDNLVIDISEPAASGSITIALEVDGSIADKAKAHEIPSGVTGLFYLRVFPPPTAVTPLNGPWFAADADNMMRPIAPAESAQYTYLETRFVLPKTWPNRRLFLESPDTHLGWIILNDQVLETPRSMRMLDISRMARKDGENVLRWVPSLHPLNYQRIYNGKIPTIQLSWLP
ncbi:MAG: hypothetical protein HY822_13805 [Acidobacteria bacterium]|nr:hypothetical protein [Acidobacteriota bacterium]